MANYMNDAANGVNSERNDNAQQRQMFDNDVSSNKRFKSLLGAYSDYEKMRLEIAKKSGLAKLQQDLEFAKRSGQATKKIEDEIALVEQQIHRQSMDATLAYRTNQYKRATVLHKAELKKQQANEIAEDRKTKEAIYHKKWAEADTATRISLTKKHKKEVLASVKAESEAREQAIKLEKSEQGKKFKELGQSVKDFAKQPSFEGAVQVAHSIAGINEGTFQQLINEQKKVVQAQKEAAEAAEANVNALLEAGFAEDSEEVAAAKAEAEAAKKQLRAEETKARYIENFAQTRDKLFDEVEGMLTTYKGHIDARLQGSDTNYKEVMGVISGNLSLSPFVKSQKVIENMKELVDKGVAYNVEQRAFLQTVSDKIANTFDAFDANLLRLIRLQQADTTAARLGMEASLTKFFNGMFQDSSYLNDMYDQVSSAIIDANATMTRDMSAQFEYIVQKWLGSLSSVGMSSETINQIATGINYLATGDVTSLASNSQLQTLIAMSASQAGLSYSDMLIKGLDAETTNRLLEGMMSYLKDIAENSDNQVVRAAYGDVFNLSMSDMKAISNLSAGDISNISSQSLSYGAMESELNSQFVKLLSRTSLTEMVDNLYNNVIFGVAEDLMNNPVTYGMYKMLGFMEDNNIDMNIPFINAAGFGLDLNTSVQDLMNLGLQLSSAVSLVGNMFAGLGSLGGTNLDAWGGTEYTKRGSSNAFALGASQGDTTQATYITTSNSSDMESSTLNAATDDAEETKKITNKNSDPGKTIDDVYKVTVEGSEGSGVQRVKEEHLFKVFQNTGSNFLHTRDSRMTFKEVSLLTHDTNLRTVFGASSLVRDNAWLNVYDNHLSDFIVGKSSSSLSVTDLAIDKYKSTVEGTLSVYDSAVYGVLSNLSFDSGGLDVSVSNMAKDPATAEQIATAISGKNLSVQNVSSDKLTTTDSNLKTVFGTASVVKDGKWLNVYDNRLDAFVSGSGKSKLAVVDSAIDSYGTASGKSKLAVYDATVKGVLDKFKFNKDDLKTTVTNMVSAPPTADAIANAISGKTLSAKVTNMAKDPPTASAIASAVATQSLKVKSSNSTGVLVDINTASRNAMKGSNVVEVSKMPTTATTVKFNYNDLAKAIVKAMGANSSDSRAAVKTIGDLYALFLGQDDHAQAHVRVQNEDGLRLQVDTEADGSNYVTNLNDRTLVW